MVFVLYYLFVIIKKIFLTQNITVIFIKILSSEDTNRANFVEDIFFSHWAINYQFLRKFIGTLFCLESFFFNKKMNKIIKISNSKRFKIYIFLKWQ